jgi:hypothetical protein
MSVRPLISIVFAALLIAGGSAQAATYTLADLTGGGTASFTSDNGTFTFSNFAVTKSKNVSNDLSLYIVTTTASGFMLTSTEFDAQSGGKRALNFSYTVTASSPIVQASLAMDATRTTGRVKVEKDIDSAESDGGTFLATLLTGSNSILNDGDSLEPGSTSWDVEEQIRIKKVSSLNSVSNDFQVVPEPGTAALLGAGIFGLAWMGRRRYAA